MGGVACKLPSETRGVFFISRFWDMDADWGSSSDEEDVEERNRRDKVKLAETMVSLGKARMNIACDNVDGPEASVSVTVSQI